jgi:Asp-tRNA(Asn)/Glu-tRNA(Gln) amidotransferase C subunit
MNRHIGLESLIQRGRSALYTEMVSLFQNTQDALYEAPGASDDYILDSLNRLGFSKKLKEVINRHTGNLVYGVKLIPTNNPHLECFIKLAEDKKNKKKKVVTLTPASVITSISNLYDPRTSKMDNTSSIGLAIQGGLVIATVFWRLRNTDNSFYFTSEELSATILHEIGHIDYCIRSVARASQRTQDASDIVEYIKTTPDKDAVLLTIKGLLSNPDLNKQNRDILTISAKYFERSNNTLNDEYLEAVSTVCMMVMMTLAEEDRGLAQAIIPGKSERMYTKSISADKERSSDEYSSRHGTYGALSSALFKLEKLYTKDGNLYQDMYSSISLYTTVSILSQFAYTFHINAEDICNGYDPLIRRIEIIAQTAKHAFKDPNLPEDVREDLKNQINEINKYIEEYKKIPHRQIRATIFTWKKNIISFGRLIAFPINTRMREDYSRLQDSTRDLSRNPLYYLTRK